MIVKVWFQQSSSSIIFNNADSTYQKGDLFCVGYKVNEKQIVKKYPIQHLFMVEESNFDTSQPELSKKDI